MVSGDGGLFIYPHSTQGFLYSVKSGGNPIQWEGTRNVAEGEWFLTGGRGGNAQGILSIFQGFPLPKLIFHIYWKSDNEN